MQALHPKIDRRRRAGAPSLDSSQIVETEESDRTAFFCGCMTQSALVVFAPMGEARGEPSGATTDEPHTTDAVG